MTRLKFWELEQDPFLSLERVVIGVSPYVCTDYVEY